MHRRFLKKFLPFLVGALVIAVGLSMLTATTATTPFYAVTDLGSDSVPYSINDARQIVGVDYHSTYGNAFLWENGKMKDIANFGGRFSQAYDISNKEQIIGISETSSQSVHAFLWQNNTPTDLGILGEGNTSFPRTINNSGQVAVESLTLANGAYTVRQALLWRNGTITNLGSLGGQLSGAYGINNRKQVVGESSTSSGQRHAFLWQNPLMTDLGTLGGNTSSAKAINDLGQVVGNSSTSQSNKNPFYHCFLWSKGTMTELAPNSVHDCYANSINNQGTVVGNFSYTYLMNQRFYPFVWRNGTIANLNRLLPPNSGWKLETANDINNDGQIVGTGIFQGKHRGVLLTPLRLIT